ncbi:MAG: tRNA 4-thiouridine(8) synthase ThiI [Firmicutes bacterium]|nr:tRNA 4-thiouridine(8) synthase ThiI [Bacillota bacterium]
MQTIILVRFGEIHLKGNNRHFFENALVNNIKKVINGKVEKSQGRIVVRTTDPNDAEKVAKIFGVVSVSIADEIENNQIEQYIKNYKGFPTDSKTFKVEVNRANKAYPLTSMDLAKKLGGIILEQNKNLKVDVVNPEYVLNIDVREKTYVFTKTLKGVGGVPVGTSGNALLFLSGGIDSPVAGWLAQKRGLKVNAMHFETPPYTSGASLEKVKALAKIIGVQKLYVVNLTDAMKEFKTKCNLAYTITLMRRLMVRVANHYNYQCIVTGENLGQVASQTIEGITTNNSLSTTPILRPLICYNKEEIIKLAKTIGTYQTSIISHQDCCAAFVPDKPVIKPTIKVCEQEENKIDYATLLDKIISSIEICEI